MPHCCPQKQQCVRTSRSGSTVVFRSSMGRVAIVDDSIRQRVLPQRTLREAEERPAATRADLLVVIRSFTWLHLVAESELLLDSCEIAHHQLRRERRAAAPAFSLLGTPASVLVEADA